MRLMKYKIAIAHGARTGTVRKAWAAAKIDEQWKENALYKSIIARRTRASLGDFKRFKLQGQEGQESRDQQGLQRAQEGGEGIRKTGLKWLNLSIFVAIDSFS